ncbi:MAG: hypothetical protein ACK4IX_02100 [Candidatus Sericytochromatia bacterium]
MKIIKLLILFLSSSILSSCLLELHGTTFYESKPWIQFTPKEKLSVPIDELINASEYITIDGEKFKFITGNKIKYRYDKYSYEKKLFILIKQIILVHLKIIRKLMTI